MAKCKSCGSPLCKGCGSPATFVDPTMASVGIEPQMTYQPPMPANQMGMAKPVFNPAVQASAEAIYGTPEQRQMSMPGAPIFFVDQTGDDKITKADVIEARTKGYQESPNTMRSPLNDNHPQYFMGGREVTKQEFDEDNKARKAKTYLGGGQGLIPDSWTGGKPTRQFLNESKLFNPTTTKEKAADLNDTRMMNAFGGNSVTGDTDNKMYQYYKKRKKEIRPNRTDRY